MEDLTHVNRMPSIPGDDVDVLRHRHAASVNGTAKTAVLVAEPSRTMAWTGAETGQRSRPTLLAIVGIGLLVRILLWASFAQQSLAIWDERDYNRLALSLLQRGEFGYEPGVLASLRPPLYPALLAVVYELTGPENYQAVRLLQCFLSLGTVVILHHLGAKVFSERVGLWTAGLYCFYPSFLGYNNLLLTEVLFTFLFCTGILGIVIALQRGSMPWLMFAGVVLGLGALTRSVLWLFPLPLGVFLLWGWHGSWPKRLVAPVLLGMGFVIVVAPWSIRNTRLEKTFVAIDTMGGRNFMMGNYAHTPEHRAWDAIAFVDERSWYAVLKADDPAADTMTQGQRDKAALRNGLQYVASHPGATARRDVIKFFQFWGLERELIAGAAKDFFGDLGRTGVVLLATVVLTYYVLVMLLAAFGVVLSPPSDRRLHVLLLLAIAFICGMHTLAFGHSRYHLPVMPLVLAYAAAAIVSGRALWQALRRPAFALACALAGLFITGWVWEVVVVEREHWLPLFTAALTNATGQ